MQRRHNTDLGTTTNVFFQCCFWLMLAIVVAGCDGVTLDNLGLGGIDRPSSSANPESYALIGTRMIDVTSDNGVIANDADAISVIAKATNTTYGGTLNLNDDGSFSYTAPADFFGTDSFDYTVELEDGTMTGTTSIKVYPADATPTP